MCDSFGAVFLVLLPKILIDMLSRCSWDDEGLRPSFISPEAEARIRQERFDDEAFVEFRDEFINAHRDEYEGDEIFPVAEAYAAQRFQDEFGRSTDWIARRDAEARSYDEYDARMAEQNAPRVTVTLADGREVTAEQVAKLFCPE